jgi:toxin YoeB
MWDVRFSKNAEKDKKLLKQAGLEEKAKKFLDILREDPFQNPPSYGKLVGDLKGYYFRRINLRHRLVYKVDLEDKIVEVRAMWTHYER